MPNQQSTKKKLAIQNLLIQLNYHDRQKHVESSDKFKLQVNTNNAVFYENSHMMWKLWSEAGFNVKKHSFNLQQQLQLLQELQEMGQQTLQELLQEQPLQQVLQQAMEQPLGQQQLQQLLQQLLQQQSKPINANSNLNSTQITEQYNQSMQQELNNVRKVISEANDELNKVLDTIKNSFNSHYQNKDEFFKEVLGSDANSSSNEILEKGFKALQKAYPDGNINDNFQKVQQDETFKDILKIILAVITFGKVKFDLQSTHKKNYESFASVINEQKQNAGQGQHQR